MPRVLYVPDLTRNLLSICRLADSMTVVFDNTGCTAYSKTDNCIFHAPKTGDLIEFITNNDGVECNCSQLFGCACLGSNNCKCTLPEHHVHHADIFEAAPLTEEALAAFNKEQDINTLMFSCLAT